MRFETYTPDRIKDQVELVNLIVGDWQGFGYPSEENLRTNYGRNPDFSADTRHYVYIEDKLVGFVSSAIEQEIDGVQYGSLQHPFVHPDYEFVEEKLMEKAIDVLRSKGATRITTNFHRSWGDMERIVEQYGYEERAIVDKFARIDFDKIYYSLIPQYNFAREIDLAKDSEIFKSFLMNTYQMSAERADWYLNWVSTSSQIFTHPVLIDDNKLRGFARVELQEETNTLYMFHISCFDEETEDIDRDRIFFYIINKARVSGMPVFLYLGGEMHKHSSLYEKYGLEFEIVKSYEIKL